MLSKFEQVQKQWGGSSDVIDQWLISRQQLLIDYCKIANLPPFQSHTRQLPTTDQLQSFSQALVDYLSTGHFKIYDMVMEKWQSTGYQPTQDIDQLYISISQTTDPLLNFSESYSGVRDEESLLKIDQELSTLGQLLERRFELEDQLIELISESLACPPGA